MTAAAAGSFGGFGALRRGEALAPTRDLAAIREQDRIDALRRARVELLHRRLLYAAITSCACMFLFPFLWSLLTSFKTAHDAAAGGFWPAHWSIEGYRVALTSLPFGSYFLHSTLLALAITASNLVFCSMGGYAFARLNFKGRDALFMLVLGAMLLPDQLRMVPVFRMLRDLGLVDHYGSVWLVGAVAPFGLFFMRQAFLAQPKELEEAAYIDGAGHTTIFFKVMLPLTTPSLVTLAILTFQGAWNEFFWPLLLLQNPDKFTLSQGLALFTSQFETQWPALMAGTVLATIPIVIIFVALQKYFVSGLGDGAVK
jgi:multiple sugar transport system permease protein